MEDMVRVIQIITSRLDTEGILYMISGSIALSVYAVPRFTNGIDLVVDILPSQQKRIIQLFENDFYISEIAVHDAFCGLGMFNMIEYQNVIKCDWILLEKDPYAKEAFQRKKKYRLLNNEFYFISLEDLIIRKLLWNKISPSGIQLNDIEQLILMNRNDLDMNYLQKVCGQKNILQDLETHL